MPDRQAGKKAGHEHDCVRGSSYSANQNYLGAIPCRLRMDHDRHDTLARVAMGRCGVR
jgi:hypothetical protein